MPAQTVGCAPLGAHALFVLNACLKDDFCFEEKRFVCFRQALRVGNAFAPEGKYSMITGYGLLDVNQFRKSAYFDCSKNNKSFLPHSCRQPLKP